MATKNVNLEELSKRIAEWNEMEQRNAHGERLQRIAGYFWAINGRKYVCDFGDILSVLHEINSLHESRGSLTFHLSEIRNTARLQLRELIKIHYGDKIAARVNP